MSSNRERDRAIIAIRTLIEDVTAARKRIASDDTPTARRDVVRASLAAMEGLVWLTRDHVRDSLRSIDELTPLADLALSENTYTVADNGKLIPQMRSLPLTTAIRLVAAQAQIIDPELDVDFAAAGWPKVRDAVSIRNRITHPRPNNDLAVSDDDLRVVGSGLSWLMATTDYIMASTNLALVRLKDMMTRLLAGDPDALADYAKALRDLT